MKNPFRKKKETSYEDPYKDRYVKVPKKEKQKMSRMGRFLLAVFFLVVFILGLTFGYKMMHYRGYQGYKEYLSSYAYEPGTTFVPLSESRSSVDGFVLVAENDVLKLYTKEETAEIAVYDKRSGETTYSNPQDYAQDLVANDTNKALLRSQFMIKYYNSAANESTFDSYNDAVAKGQISVSAIKDGIRYTYRVGNIKDSTGIVPRYIPEKKLSAVTGKLSEDVAAKINNSYKESYLVEGFYELTAGALASEAILHDLNVWFGQAGFTVDDYVKCMTDAGKDTQLSPNFSVDVEYRLQGDQLVVSVPACSLIEGGGAKLFRLQLLPFFGAAGVEQEGYIFVPGGSGSLIYLNNGKTNGVADYSQFVYGLDPVAQDYTKMENTKDVRLPVFGLHTKETDLFAEITDGSSLSLITASVSGKLNSYNYVYPTFVLRGFDRLSMFGTTGNEGDIPIVEAKLYDVNMEVTYSFLTKEYEGYVGMAGYYREKLQERGEFPKEQLSADAVTPFYYDVIGAYKKTKFVVGAQYLGEDTVTTFAEAMSMAEELDALGVKGQVMNFMGWMNGGYYHDVPDQIHVVNKLGGKKGLTRLQNQMQALGGKLYCDVAFQNVTSISKRYEENYETSRYYGAGYVVKLGQVDPSSLRQTASLGYKETVHYLLSPRFLDRYVNAFAKKVTAYDMDGIALRDLGSQLHSDKRRTCIINREEALQIVKAQLICLDGAEKDLMFSDANVYALPYADDLINIPTRDNRYYIVDEAVPFYELLVHGYIPYGGRLLNTNSSADAAKNVLNLIEYGAAPHFVFTWESATELKYTGLNRFYSTKFDNWKQDAADTYAYVSAALDAVSGAVMSGHEILGKDLRKVTYSNGVVFYINYSDEDCIVEGMVIPAKGYVKGGE